MLALESSPKHELKKVSLSSALGFFDFPALPEDTYVVTARSSLSARTHSTVAVPVSVKLAQHSHVVVNFDAQLKAVSQDVSQSSIASLLFLMLVFLAIWNRETVRALARSLCSS